LLILERGDSPHCRFGHAAAAQGGQSPLQILPRHVDVNRSLFIVIVPDLFGRE
jgi:hypothetical protein